MSFDNGNTPTLMIVPMQVAWQGALTSSWTRCLEYVSSADPGLQLDIGSLSIIRIQSTFAIFKQLVMEARASSSKFSHEDQQGEESTGSNMSVVLKENEDLRSCLEQRDNELKILVNMVKQKTRAPDQMMSNVMSKSLTDVALRADYIQGAYGSRTMPSGPHAGELLPTAAAGADGKHSPRAAPSAKSSKPDRQRLTTQPQYVYGILPPSDTSVLSDPQQSFEYFMQRLQGSDVLAPIEANKQVLKEKMLAAKALGEKANASRNSIEYLKRSIEMVRKEKAVQVTLRVKLLCA